MTDTLKVWLKKVKLDNLKISSTFLEVQFSFQESDKEAAWQLYVELLTRVTTQPLENDYGCEQAALNSLYLIFPNVRQILKENHGCNSFCKIAIPFLNQVIRPFTTKWHSILFKHPSLPNDFKNDFRLELREMQEKICTFSTALASMAGVEDLTNLEEENLCVQPLSDLEDTGIY